MKTYKAYLSQEGGCDYTIGCGMKLLTFSAESMEKAFDQLYAKIKENYTGERQVSKIELFEVVDSFIPDVTKVYAAINQEKTKAQVATQEKKDREEYNILTARLEQLKQKYNS